MAVSLKHAFQSAKPDGADTSIVRPSDWNAEHVLTQATGKLLGRTTAGAGATEEISVGSNLTLASGSLNVAANPSFVGKAQFEASVATGAKVNLGNGVNVTSNLVDGDIWVEGNNFRWQANGTTWRASAVGHTHTIANITSLQTTLDAKLNAADTTYVKQDGTTGSAYLPSGTTAQRPGAPAAGYIRYNTTTGKFEGYGSAWGNIGGGAAIGDTPPANPGAGDLWWNSADGRMYVYYADANSSQWVDLSAGGAGQYLPLTGGTVTGTLNLSGALVTTDGTSTTRVLNSGGAGIVGTESNHPLVFQANSAERMRIDTSGRVTTPNQPMFFGFRDGASWVGSTTPAVWVCNNVTTNNGNHYNTSTGVFTCPVAGYYRISGSLMAGNTQWGTVLYFKNGVASQHLAHGNSNGVSVWSTVTMNAIVYCAANDTLSLGYVTSGANAIYQFYNTLTIELVG